MYTKQNMEDQLIKRFPRLELSYETAAHKKVSTHYDICISIPAGKKSFMWFTYEGADDVCYLLDINKDQKITKATKVTTLTTSNYEFALGTILYGSLCSVRERQVFVVEDIYYYCGLPLKQLTFGEKLTYYKMFMTKYPMNNNPCIALPFMCSVQGDNKLLDSLQFYESMTLSTSYPTHHVQFRSSQTISPYLNHVYKKRQDFVPTVSTDAFETILFPRTDLDHYAQMALKTAVFRVKADIQNDIYHLFAADGYYTNIAYIENRQSSKYMNSLFRNIRENINIDYGEESEDEDIFQNTSLDKYVDLKKEYKMN